MEKHCGNCDLEYYCTQKVTNEKNVCDDWRPDFYARAEMDQDQEPEIFCESCMIQR